MNAMRILLSLSLIAAAGALAQGSPPPQGPRQMPMRLQSEYTGDLDALLERRVARVVAPYSRTLYFNDKGRERGLSADFVRDFERFVNQKYAKQLGKRPFTVVIRSVTRDKLLSEVAQGRADIAVGNLTATEERRKVVDFVAPEGMKAVDELVVTGPKSPAISVAEDLSDKTVHVRPSSSYHESLLALNERLRKTGKAPARIVPVPDALEDEDMMEMVSAGVLDAIVVDDWKARMWLQVLPKLKVNGEAIVRAGGKVGWALRKDSPKLSGLLNEFYSVYVQKQGLYNARMKQYFARIRQLKDPTGSADRKRFEDTLALFRKYGAQYHFDPLMLAAQGYQESQLDQNAQSQVGAIGIMQLMPATGAELRVGDIRIAENNVHAGAKYMDQLLTRYLADATFDETNRTLFAFAAYNCGPGNIARMRNEAAKRGLDPNVWLNNVEVVTAEKIGLETTTYVRNIYKYYVAYKLMEETAAAQQKAREAVKNAS